MAGSGVPGITRVLVIRIGRLGDTILATPVIEALISSLGAGVSIDFVTSRGASAQILSMDQRVNRVFPVAHRRIHWRLHPEKRVIQRYSQAHPYDLVINLECGAECDDFIRFVHHGKFCGRPLVEPQHGPDRHCVDTEKAIYAQLLGRKLTAEAGTSLHIDAGVKPLPVADEEGFVVLNPGFSGLGRTGYRTHRGWPPESWLELAAMIRENTGLAVLVNGTSAEREYFAELLRQNRVHSLFGSDLPTLMFALQKARALVTVDTGTMHLATALGTPVVALFGPGNPVLTGPYSPADAHRVMTSGIDCQPCVGTPAEKACKSNRCMQKLRAADVFDGLQQLVGSPLNRS